MEFLENIVVALLGVGFGWFWGHWQAITAWKKKEFRNNLVLSLNAIFPSSKEDCEVGLKLRTLFAKEIKDIFPNKKMRDLINEAIDGTTKERAILAFKKEDSWHILNGILNQIAQMYPEGSLKEDMGIETHKKWYVFCVTFERDGSMRTQKPRVMMMNKEKFLTFPLEGKIELEDADRHETRVRTLRSLKGEYEKNPHLFLEMEISF